MTENEGIRGLIDYWKDFKMVGGEPHVHPDDREIMGKRAQTNASYSERSSAEAFFELPAHDQTCGFHLSLMPVPYMGNLESADIFLLMVNPSLGYADYGTNATQSFRAALSRNLKQEFAAGGEQCVALDPEYWWSSWFIYYERLLRRTVREYANAEKISYLQSLNTLSRRLAILELVPYYSANASQITKPFLKRLKSAQRAIKAGQELARKAEARDATVIVRWSDRWNLGSARGIISNTSPNGFRIGHEAILKRLLSKQ